MRMTGAQGRVRRSRSPYMQLRGAESNVPEKNPSLLHLLLVFALLCGFVHGEAPADFEGDLHYTSIRHYLREQATEPLRHEVLLVGDGEKMRFWPMWSFYKYLVASTKPSPALGHESMEEAKVRASESRFRLQHWYLSCAVELTLRIGAQDGDAHHSENPRFQARNVV